MNEIRTHKVQSKAQLIPEHASDIDHTPSIAFATH